METVKQIIHHTFMLAACFCCLGLAIMPGCCNERTTTAYTAAPGVTDYAFFFFNLEENVSTRINAYNASR